MNFKENYETPSIEIVELEMESSILTMSGEDSFPEFGE